MTTGLILGKELLLLNDSQPLHGVHEADRHLPHLTHHARHVHVHTQDQSHIPLHALRHAHGLVQSLQRLLDHARGLTPDPDLNHAPDLDLDPRVAIVRVRQAATVL